MTHSHTCSHLASGCPAPREVQLTSNHQPSRKQVRMRSPSLGILKSSPMFCPDSYAEGSAKGGLGLGLATGWVPPWHLPQSLGAVQTSSSPSLPSLTSTSKCWQKYAPPNGVCLRAGQWTALPEVKNLSAVQETWVPSLGLEDSLEKDMATHTSILAWEIPWTEKPGRLQSTGSQRASKPPPSCRRPHIATLFCYPICILT